MATIVVIPLFFINTSLGSGAATSQLYGLGYLLFFTVMTIGLSRVLDSEQRTLAIALPATVNVPSVLFWELKNMQERHFDAVLGIGEATLALLSASTTLMTSRYS